jgi:hypothetical protein
VLVDDRDLIKDQDASVLKVDGGRLSGTRYVNNFFFTPDAAAEDALRRVLIRERLQFQPTRAKGRYHEHSTLSVY